MKKIVLNVLKGLLVLVLFTGGSILLSTSGVNAVSEANAAVKKMDVVHYLQNLGYTVVSCNPIQGTENWLAHTILDGKDLATTIYVQGNNIVDHEDVGW